MKHTQKWRKSPVCSCNLPFPDGNCICTFLGRMISSRNRFMGSPSRWPKHHQLRLSNNYHPTTCWEKRNSSDCASHLARSPFGHIAYAFLPLQKILPETKGALYRVEKHMWYNQCANLSKSLLVLLGNTRIHTLKPRKKYGLYTLLEGNIVGRTTRQTHNKSNKIRWDRQSRRTQVLTSSNMIFADLDECQEQNHNCDGMAHCSNTVGSFNCTCLQGFTGDGISCFGMILNLKI